MSPPSSDQERQPNGSVRCGAWQLVKDHRSGWQHDGEPTHSDKLVTALAVPHLGS
jgi:hypothetical protein